MFCSLFDVRCVLSNVCCLLFAPSLCVTCVLFVLWLLLLFAACFGFCCVAYCIVVLGLCVARRVVFVARWLLSVG